MVGTLPLVQTAASDSLIASSASPPPTTPPHLPLSAANTTNTETLEHAPTAHAYPPTSSPKNPRLKNTLERIFRRAAPPPPILTSSANSAALLTRKPSATPRSSRRLTLRSSLSRPSSWFGGTPSTPSLDTLPMAVPHYLRLTPDQISRRCADLEYAQRRRLADGAQPLSDGTPHAFARLPAVGEVARRNRYANIDPFAANRVVLHGAGPGECDYINASWIALQGKAGERRYIAAQGPKDSSAAHMWRMIYHTAAEPAVVVMLTQTHEAGREKCFQYFPLAVSAPHQLVAGDDDWQAQLVLKSAEYDERLCSTVREMELQTPEGTKNVVHYLFERWPDFGVPEGADRAALVELVRATDERAGSGDAANPRIVHCSAGVGRTGTFIALDHLLAELEAGALDEAPESRSVDPIAETVDTLRQQRMMMVQGEQQLQYLYETLRAEWETRAEQRLASGGDAD